MNIPQSVGTALLVGLAALMAYVFWSRWGMPLRNPLLRGRPIDHEYWSCRYAGDDATVALRVLTAICESFALSEDEVDQLRLEDALMDIYKAQYPHRWNPDNLDFEYLHRALNERFDVPDRQLAQIGAFTVREAIDLALRHRSPPNCAAADERRVRASRVVSAIAARG